LSKMQRDKGARFERELAEALKGYGYDCRRTCQKDGRVEADVIGLPGIHIEAKHQEQMRLYDWMHQAEKDARPGEIPAVFHRKNREETLVTVPLWAFMELFKRWGRDGDGKR